MHQTTSECFNTCYIRLDDIMHKMNEEKSRHTPFMQETEVERKRNTNSKDSSFASITGVLELIDRTLVYGIFLLQAKNDRKFQAASTATELLRNNECSTAEERG